MYASLSGEVTLAGIVARAASARLAGDQGLSGASRRTTSKAQSGSADSGSIVVLRPEISLESSIDPSGTVGVARYQSVDGDVSLGGSVDCSLLLHLAGRIGDALFDPEIFDPEVFDTGYTLSSGIVKTATITLESDVDSEAAEAITSTARPPGGASEAVGGFLSNVLERNVGEIHLRGEILPHGVVSLDVLRGTPRRVRFYEKNRDVLLAEIDDDLSVVA